MGNGGALPGMATRNRKRSFNINAVIGLTPMFSVAIGVFVICIAYSVVLSFTGSRLFPKFDNFVGLENYTRLWSNQRWLISIENLAIYGTLVIALNLAIGFVLAACMDREVRQENALRTVILYPYAMSLVVTGLIWQWMLDPNLGLQRTFQGLGLDLAILSPLVDPSTAIYGVVLAGIWQGSGVTMAILLAGLRGIDTDIWKAARVDGIPAWRVYLFVALPMIRGALATAFVLQAVSVVRVYDLVIAMTGGGPGIATEMPAKFVVDHISTRVNVALGMAAATMMLAPILFLIASVGLARWRSAKRRARA